MPAPHVKEVVVNIGLIAAAQIALYYAVKWAMDSDDGETRAEVQQKSKDALQRMGHAKLKLTPFEKRVANEIIHPDDIPVNFSDIGGLDNIIDSLRESVIVPLIHPHLFSSTSSLLNAPRGVMLHGPPGCGKTMLAKALAKESGATFINIPASALTSKWFGESNKLVAALFSLARKAAPAIIFIDEIDSFLRERSSSDHEVTALMKAEFMTHWDGLNSSTDRIVVLGATNRPEDIDPAFLRRMPKHFAVGRPGAEQRAKILKLILADTRLEPDFPMNRLVDETEGLSGSDLKELCRAAAMAPVREFLRKHMNELAGMKVTDADLRLVTIEDFWDQDSTNTITNPIKHDAAILGDIDRVSPRKPLTSPTMD